MNKAILKLVSGTAISQALVMLSIPLLSRIYSTDSFADLTIIVSYVVILSSISSFKLDLALCLERCNIKANGLFGLSLIILFLFFVFCLFGVLAFVTLYDVDPVIIFIPFGVLLCGLTNTLVFKCNREGKFGLIAKSRVIQTILGLSAQIVLGYFLYEHGLVFGQIVLLGGGVIFLFLADFQETYKNIFRTSRNELLPLLKSKYKYLVYTTPETLISTAGQYLPIAMMAFYVDAKLIAFLGLSNRIAQQPISLFASSISQAYMSVAPRLFEENNLYEHTIRLVRKIALSYTPVLVMLWFLFEPYVGDILGDQWLGIETILMMMLMITTVQMATTPIINSLHVVGKQKVALGIQFYGCVLRVGSVFFAEFLFGSYHVETYVASCILFYTVALATTLFSIKTIEIHCIGKK